ncbi:MAG: permease-like cell division protein FtsX [bacterium]|nr:permease-like cell division protein FtsX [bacterium]
MFISLARAIRFAFQQMRRNLWLSIATITLLVLPLLSINIVLGLGALAQTASSSIQDKVDVSVYFKTTTTNDQVQSIRESLLSMTEVKQADFVSREGALERFKTRHANDPTILESLNELAENPFGATLAVKARSMNDYPKIMTTLEQPAYSDLIEEKNFDDHRETISRIDHLMKNVRSFGAGVAALFSLIAILIVLNSIRMAIYTHREEIGIMRLVGAGGWFIRGPFLFEALFFSLVAIIITLLIIYPSINMLQPYLNNLFEGMDVDMLRYFNHNFLLIFGGEFLGIVILTFLSTALAIRRYLKV